MVLQLNGFSVESAVNGREGLTRMRARKPAAVVLDVMMPVLDGFGFRAEQLEDPALRDVPVVCASAGADQRAHDRLRCDAYLPKPIDIDRLVATLLRLASVMPLFLRV